MIVLLSILALLAADPTGNVTTPSATGQPPSSEIISAPPLPPVIVRPSRIRSQKNFPQPTPMTGAAPVLYSDSPAVKERAILRGRTNDVEAAKYLTAMDKWYSQGGAKQSVRGFAPPMPVRPQSMKGP